jgi:drug/metabolite transporter (DMT)-like permease
MVGVTLSPAPARPAAPAGLALPLAAGAAGMTFVGGSVAASALLVAAPLCTVQALRYAVACLLLLGYARARGLRVRGPRGADWWWLLGITGTGLVLFNVALVHGSRHAEPAALGVAVSCVPLLLAVIGPVQRHELPRTAVLAAAVIVTCGAGLVQGLGRSDAAGLGWAVVVLLCEAGFTLLAVPVLGRHGALGVSVHTTWLAAVMFGVLAVGTEGPSALGRLGTTELLAGGYLAVGVTAVAFVLWYTCVDRVGAGRAGLLTGVAPIAAAMAGVALGGPMPRPLVWAGVATVVAGLVLGLVPGRAIPATPGGGPPPGPEDLPGRAGLRALRNGPPRRAP